MANTVQAGSLLDAATWGGSVPTSGIGNVYHACTGPAGTLSCALNIRIGGSLEVTGAFVLGGSIWTYDQETGTGYSITFAEGASLTANGSTYGVGPDGNGTASRPLICASNGCTISITGGCNGGSGQGGTNGGDANVEGDGAGGAAGITGGACIVVDGEAYITIGGAVSGGSGGGGGSGGSGYADGDAITHGGGGGGTGGNGGYGIHLTSNASGWIRIGADITGGNGGGGGNGGSEGNWNDTYFGGGGGGGGGGNGALAIYEESGSESVIGANGTWISGTAGGPGSPGSGGTAPGSAGPGGSLANAASTEGNYVDLDDYQLKTDSVLLSAIDDNIVKDGEYIYATTGGAYVLGTYEGGGAADYPATSDVKKDVEYANGTMTGLCCVPSPADVRHAIDVGTTSGLAYIPSAADVRYGRNVDQTTGTCRVPGAEQVRYGILIDATTGTCYVPSAANTRYGIAVDNGWGTCRVPTAAQTEQGVAVDVSGTGTFTHTTDYQAKTNSVLLSAISAAIIKSGETIDATAGENHVDGTYDPMAAAVFPGQAYVLIGVDYGPTGSDYSGEVDLDALLAEAAADQLTADQAEVAAEVANILNGTTILGQSGTLTPTFPEPADVVSDTHYGLTGVEYVGTLDLEAVEAEAAADQLVIDQAAVLAQVDHIELGISILSQAGTLDLDAVEAAGAAAQLVVDQAAVAANVGKIISGTTILAQAGTFVRPVEAVVKLGEHYGAGGSQYTGTYGGPGLPASGSGTLSSAVLGLMSLLADSDAFRGLTSTADHAAAMTRIYRDKLPAPAGNRDTYTAAELATLCPYGLVGVPDGPNLRSYRTGTLAWSNSGTLWLALVRIASDDQTEAEADAEWEDVVGSIVDEIGEGSEISGNLFITQVRLELIGRPPREDEVAKGLEQVAFVLVDWGVSSGGGGE